MSLSILEILHEVIHVDFHIPIQTNMVIEELQSCECKQVIIRNTGRAFAFTLDKPGKEPFPFFGDVEGINLKNDAILFCVRDQKLIVFIMELKSRNPDDGIKQLRAGKHFVDYVLNMVNCL
jgi:hypothetical protein